MKKKAFTLAMMPALVISFVVFVIVVAIGGTVLSDIRDTQTGNDTTGDADYNATTKGMTGIVNIANWAPTIGTILGAILIIGLVGYFAFRTGG